MKSRTSRVKSTTSRLKCRTSKAGTSDITREAYGAPREVANANFEKRSPTRWSICAKRVNVDATRGVRHPTVWLLNHTT